MSAARFETSRLVIHELAPEDLGAVFDVYATNGPYLELTSGVGGEPGHFDLEALQRDYAVAQAMPGRHMDGIYLREGDGPIGVLDWIEENPADDIPWIGLVIVHAGWQRRGIATEAVDGLGAHLRARGAERVRMAVIERNEPALALAGSLGLDQVTRTERRLVAEEKMLVFERVL